MPDTDRLVDGYDLSHDGKFSPGQRRSFIERIRSSEDEHYIALVCELAEENRRLHAQMVAAKKEAAGWEVLANDRADKIRAMQADLDRFALVARFALRCIEREGMLTRSVRPGFESVSALTDALRAAVGQSLPDDEPEAALHFMRKELGLVPGYDMPTVRFTNPGGLNPVVKPDVPDRHLDAGEMATREDPAFWPQ